MPKFTQIYNQMRKEHQVLFDEFKTIHDLFAQSKKEHSVEFNRIGKLLMDILREYEDRLCSGMERGVFGKYSDKVSEKYWQRVKKDYPLIEFVGVEFGTV